MTLTVLSDDQIRSILENLTVQELQSAMDALRSALHEYSTCSQSTSSIHQPERTSVSSKATGATTLFMPSCSSLGTGIKVITLSSSSSSSSSIIPSSSSSSPSLKSSSSSATATATTESRHHRPPPPPPAYGGVGGDGVGDGAAAAAAAAAPPNIKPTGAITLFSPHGTPIGFLHASTLTAFRTALASMCLVARRDKVARLVVFGTGEQAYWHVRLALLLRGHTIKSVIFVNRTFSDSCRDVLERFLPGSERVNRQAREREGWQEAKFEVLTRAHQEYGRLLEKEMLAADVVFCCTPSREVLWDGGLLTSKEGRRKGRLIVAIGSWTREMKEVPGEVIRQALNRKEWGPHKKEHHHVIHHHHWHKHAVEGGVIVVDTVDGALKEAGELIEAGVGAQELVELGELVMLRKILFADESEDNHDQQQQQQQQQHHHHQQHEGEEDSDGEESSSKRKKEDKHLAKWLQKGNVIYKSVGLGLMDLTVGMHVVKLAKEKGVGSHIEGF